MIGRMFGHCKAKTAGLPRQKRQRLLLMLDEFPALGRLDFFETALAFMAGYSIKSVLIAQSLNQIEKAYGTNNSILDNCHVRVCFATNDERTAKRVSEALGTATELRALKNYAGHRLSPWLGHLMVSRSETPRPLLTPGEVMQLPPSDEIVMVAGMAPIKAKKARYYADERFVERLLPPPAASAKLPIRPDDWSQLPPIEITAAARPVTPTKVETQISHKEHRKQPELGAESKTKAPETIPMDFGMADTEMEERVKRMRQMQSKQQRVARQASLDPSDGLEI